MWNYVNRVVGTSLKKVYVSNQTNQRDYFSFYDYEYVLDVTKQNMLLPEQKDLVEGLKESYDWFKNNRDEIVKKDYIKFIQPHFE